MNHDAHVLTSHEVVLYPFDIEKVRVRSPEQFCGIRRHVKWRAGIMLEPRVVPPLAEENVHRIFLSVREKYKTVVL